MNAFIEAKASAAIYGHRGRGEEHTGNKDNEEWSRVVKKMEWTVPRTDMYLRCQSLGSERGHRASPTLEWKEQGGGGGM